MTELRARLLWLGLPMLMVHGLLLLFLAPLVGWGWWAVLLLAVTAAQLLADRLPERGERVWRALRIAYLVLVGVPVAGHLIFALFHNPLAVIGIALLTGWLVGFLWARLDALAGFMAGVALALAVFIPAVSREGYALLPTMTVVATVGVALLYFMVFGGWLRQVGTTLFVLFFSLFCLMAVNDVFYHGRDTSAQADAHKPGITPILYWLTPPNPVITVLGTDLRFMARGYEKEYLIGSARGVYAATEKELRALPVGPAGDNVAVDAVNRRLYVPTRDGRLSLFASDGVGLATSAPLPHGALTAQLAPEGVYAIDEWRFLGVYDPANLTLLRERRVGPVSDVLPDGRGGYFLTTLTGRLEHHRLGLATQTAALRRGGLFHLLAYDPDGTRLFVSNMASTRLQVFSTIDLSLQREIIVDRGCRNVYWEASRNMLIYGSYFVGDLVALDGTDFHEIGRLHLGRRMRTIMPDGPGKVMVASGGGLFVVDLAAAFGSGPRE